MTEGERIRYLRKGVLKKTLEEFGQVIGLGKGAMSAMETGQRGVTDQTIKSICREFNVSEAWLRTGEGDMFLPDPEDEIDAMVRARGLDPRMGILIRQVLQLPQDAQGIVFDFIIETAEKLKEWAQEEEMTIDEKVARYRRELELEEEARRSAASTYGKRSMDA